LNFFQNAKHVNWTWFERFLILKNKTRLYKHVLLNNEIPRPRMSGVMLSG